MISERAKKIGESQTLAITAKAKKMKADGLDVVGFGAGEPDFNTPDLIKQAGKKAIDDNKTRYTPASGTPELKKIVAQAFKKNNNLDYAPEQITINCGAKHTIFNIIGAVLNPEEEVILFAPYWVSYPEMVNFFDGKVRVIDTADNDFHIDKEKLQNTISDRTKIIILNSPSNPTGVLYTKEELEIIAQVAIENNILVISDEIYEKLIYKDAPVSIASLNEKIKDLTVTVNGVSKTYAMTGWRIGYAAGPIEIIKAVNRLQSHSTSNPASIAQEAAVAALTMDQQIVEEMRKEFDKRRQYIVERLNSFEGVNCYNPEGAFYVFPDVKGILQKFNIPSTMDLTSVFLDKIQVAVVPGEPFGAPGFIRLSYATSMENIEKGLDRIEKFINQ